MNDWDRNNLHFILDCDDEELDDFYSWASTDDLEYALRLVQTAKAELLVQELEILDVVEGYDDAVRVLKHVQSL